MKVYGVKSYSQLYRMLRQIEGDFALTLPDGNIYTGNGKNPELGAVLLCADTKVSGTFNLTFENNRDALKGINYMLELERA